MRPCILIVEDDQDVYDTLKMVLDPLGYHVEIAVNGQEGIAKARSLLPLLIFLDASMPILDGWRALAELQKDVCTRAIPVVMISGGKSTEDRPRALALGAKAYLAKPFQYENMVDQLEVLASNSFRR